MKRTSSLFFIMAMTVMMGLMAVVEEAEGVRSVPLQDEVRYTREHILGFYPRTKPRLIYDLTACLFDDCSYYYRNYNGSHNNDWNWGAADDLYHRVAGCHYADGISEPKNNSFCTGREISNDIYKPPEPLAGTAAEPIPWRKKAVDPKDAMQARFRSVDERPVKRFEVIPEVAEAELCPPYSVMSVMMTYWEEFIRHDMIETKEGDCDWNIVTPNTEKRDAHKKSLANEQRTLEDYLDSLQKEKWDDANIEPSSNRGRQVSHLQQKVQHAFELYDQERAYLEDEETQDEPDALRVAAERDFEEPQAQPMDKVHARVEEALAWYQAQSDRDSLEESRAVSTRDAEAPALYSKVHSMLDWYRAQLDSGDDESDVVESAHKRGVRKYAKRSLVPLSEHAASLKAQREAEEKRESGFDPYATVYYKRSANNYDEVCLFGLEKRSADEKRIVSPCAEQFNNQTAFLDASVVYGTTQERSDALRTFIDGKMKLDGNGMPPLANTLSDFVMEGFPGSELFAFGDARGNRNPFLAALHVIFVREHNRYVTSLKQVLWDRFDRHPRKPIPDEFLFQEGRRWISALIQKITYEEYLPKLLGRPLFNELIGSEYPGYNRKVNPRIANEFANIAYLRGHREVDGACAILDENWKVLEEHVANVFPEIVDYSKVFYQTKTSFANHDIESFFRGMISYQPFTLFDVPFDYRATRLFFTWPQDPLHDLTAVAVQRGRDHGLANFNDLRLAYNLTEKNYYQISLLDNVIQLCRIEDCWTNITTADAFPLGLLEDREEFSMLGQTFARVVAEQFVRTREGDRFFYQNVEEAGTFPYAPGRNTLLHVIERNTDLEDLEKMGCLSAFYKKLDFEFPLCGQDCLDEELDDKYDHYPFY